MSDGKLQVIFATNNMPFSLLIKLFTWSQWCHCAILDGDFVIDSTLLSGVRRIPFRKWKKHYKHWEFTYIDVKDTQESIRFARRQVGKKYDPLGILSLVAKKNYNDTDKWFCSELVAAAIGVEQNKAWLFTPEWLWKYFNCKDQLGA